MTITLSYGAPRAPQGADQHLELFRTTVNYTLLPSNHQEAPLLPVLGGLFGVLEFGVAAVVAALVDELLRLGEFLLVAKEARAIQVDVRHVQLHGAALGDLPRLVQVGLAGVRVFLHEAEQCLAEQGARQVVKLARATETISGLFDFGLRIADLGFGEDGFVEGRAAQAQVVQGDREE